MLCFQVGVELSMLGSRKRIDSVLNSYGKGGAKAEEQEETAEKCFQENLVSMLL